MSGNDQAGQAGEVYFASLLSPGVFYWLADLVWPIPPHCSSSLMVTGRPGTSNTFNGSVRDGRGTVKKRRGSLLRLAYAPT